MANGVTRRSFIKGGLARVRSRRSPRAERRRAPLPQATAVPGRPEARATADEDERKAKYREINKTVGKNLSIIPIMHYSHGHVGSDRVASLFYDAGDRTHLVDASLAA